MHDLFAFAARLRSRGSLLLSLCGVAVVAASTLSLAGCGGGDDNGTTVVPSPSPIASPSPAASPSPDASPSPTSTRTGLLTATFARGNGANLSSSPLSAPIVSVATVTAKPIPNPDPSGVLHKVLTLAAAWTDGNLQTAPRGTLVRRLAVSFSDTDALIIGKAYPIAKTTPNVFAFPNAVNYTENVAGTTVGQKAYEATGGTATVTAISGDTYTIALRGITLNAAGYQATGTATVNGNGRLDRVTQR